MYIEQRNENYALVLEVPADTPISAVGFAARAANDALRSSDASTGFLSMVATTRAAKNTLVNAGLGIGLRSEHFEWRIPESGPQVWLLCDDGYENLRRRIRDEDYDLRIKPEYLPQTE